MTERLDRNRLKELIEITSYGESTYLKVNRSTALHDNAIGLQIVKRFLEAHGIKDFDINSIKRALSGRFRIFSATLPDRHLILSLQETIC